MAGSAGWFESELDFHAETIEEKDSVEKKQLNNDPGAVQKDPCACHFERMREIF
ncbi:MAG: hypothetical protein ACE5IY_21750 [bacterium]